MMRAISYLESQFISPCRCFQTRIARGIATSTAQFGLSIKMWFRALSLWRGGRRERESESSVRQYHLLWHLTDIDFEEIGQIFGLCLTSKLVSPASQLLGRVTQQQSCSLAFEPSLVFLDKDCSVCRNRGDKSPRQIPLVGQTVSSMMTTLEP